MLLKRAANNFATTPLVIKAKDNLTNSSQLKKYNSSFLKLTVHMPQLAIGWLAETI